MIANVGIGCGIAWIDLERSLIPGQGLVKSAQGFESLPDLYDYGADKGSNSAAFLCSASASSNRPKYIRSR